MIGDNFKEGYWHSTVESDDSKSKTYLSHKFIFESYNGLVPDGHDILHIN